MKMVELMFFYYQNCHSTNYHDWANSVQMHCLKQESNSELRAQFSSVSAFVSSPLQSYQLIAFSQETLYEVAFSEK